MKYHVDVLPTAQRELDSIVEWIAKKSPAGAQRLILAFDRRLTELENHPERHPLSLEGMLYKLPIQEFHFKIRHGRQFRALYHVLGDRVEILHVRGPGQDALTREDIQ